MDDSPAPTRAANALQENGDKLHGAPRELRSGWATITSREKSPTMRDTTGHFCSATPPRLPRELGDGSADRNRPAEEM